MIKWFLSWIDNYFQTESSRRQKARRYLSAAGVKDGQIDALMKTIVPLSHFQGFDVLECCKVLSQVAMIGKLLPGEYRHLMHMNFPVFLVLSDTYFADTSHILKMISEGKVDWHRLAVGIIWYHDELQKN